VTLLPTIYIASQVQQHGAVRFGLKPVIWTDIIIIYKDKNSVEVI
jgi:hypothetical protein